MSEFEIYYEKGKNICVNITCSKCQKDFSTELDDFSQHDFPFSINEKLYCIYCEAPYDYTIRINQNKLSFHLEENSIYGNLEYSKIIDEPEEFFQFVSTSDSEKFYKLQIKTFRKLLDTETKNDFAKQSLNRLIFSGIITSMETYLNEILLAIVFNSDNTLEKFVNQYEPYKKEVFSLNTIFSINRNISGRVKDDIDNLIYHNIGKMINVFGIFNFELDKFDKIGTLSKCVKKRHNLVHKSGLNDFGNFQEVSDEEILKLIDDLNLFVEYISNKIEEKCFLPTYLKDGLIF